MSVDVSLCAAFLNVFYSEFFGLDLFGNIAVTQFTNVLYLKYQFVSNA